MLWGVSFAVVGFIGTAGHSGILCGQNLMRATAAALTLPRLLEVTVAFRALSRHSLAWSAQYNRRFPDGGVWQTCQSCNRAHRACCQLARVRPLHLGTKRARRARLVVANLALAL